MKKRVMMSWSSGKDSAWALYQLLQDPNIEVVGIFTTINKTFERVAMHAVRVELLKMQAKCLNLPLTIIELPFPCSNEQYQKVMGEFVDKVKNDNIDAMAFGDLFLQDIKDYRISNLQGTGIEAIFPIWGKDTKELAIEMIASDVKTVLTCVDPKQLSPNFAGRKFDQSLLSELPKNVDPCGENGEFHSFVYDGPMFNSPIAIEIGETVERDGFVFTDLQAK